MPIIAVAAVLGALSYLCRKADKKGLSMTLGVLAFFAFIAWLKISGIGEGAIDFFNDPTVNVPDNIPIPGGK
jgi:hypothetical protein